MPGRIIGEYQIIQTLGSGAFSKVLLVRHIGDRHKYALKVLSGVASSKEVRQLDREARIYRKLYHPFIVKIEGFKSTDIDHFLVMEYAEGNDLSEIINAGRLSINDTIQIAWRVCKALEHAHSKGVVHQDIKPQNIIVGKGNNIKVTDFGIASITNHSISSLSVTSAMGTIHYISPEQLKGKRGVKRSDLYSLGVVMYEMLAGSPPFDASLPESVMYQLVHEEPKKLSVLRSNVPKELVRIVHKALSKSPNDRFRTATEMCKALEDVALQRHIPLDEVIVPTGEYIKHVFFDWPKQRIREVVTELGANLINWIIIAILTILLGISNINHSPEPGTSIATAFSIWYQNLGNKQWLIKWVLPSILLAVTGLTLYWHRKRNGVFQKQKSSVHEVFSQGLSALYQIILEIVNYHFRWLLLAFLSLIFLPIFLSIEPSKGITIGLTIIITLFFISSLALIFYAIIKGRGSAGSLDARIFFVLCSTIIFVEFFSIHFENINLAFREGAGLVSNVSDQSLDRNVQNTPSRPLIELPKNFISFDTGESTAESILWLFLMLFGLAGMLSSEEPLQGLLIGAIAGAVVGGIFGPIISSAMEFGRSFPNIFP